MGWSEKKENIYQQSIPMREIKYHFFEPKLQKIAWWNRNEMLKKVIKQLRWDHSL